MVTALEHEKSWAASFCLVAFRTCCVVVGTCGHRQEGPLDVPVTEVVPVGERRAEQLLPPVGQVRPDRVPRALHTRAARGRRLLPQAEGARLLGGRGRLQTQGRARCLHLGREGDVVHRAEHVEGCSDRLRAGRGHRAWLLERREQLLLRLLLRPARDEVGQGRPVLRALGQLERPGQQHRLDAAIPGGQHAEEVVEAAGDLVGPHLDGVEDGHEDTLGLRPLRGGELPQHGVEDGAAVDGAVPHQLTDRVGQPRPGTAVAVGEEQVQHVRHQRVDREPLRERHLRASVAPHCRRTGQPLVEEGGARRAGQAVVDDRGAQHPGQGAVDVACAATQPCARRRVDELCDPLRRLLPEEVDEGRFALVLHEVPEARPRHPLGRGARAAEDDRAHREDPARLVAVGELLVVVGARELDVRVDVAAPSRAGGEPLLRLRQLLTVETQEELVRPDQVTCRQQGGEALDERHPRLVPRHA